MSKIKKFKEELSSIKTEKLSSTNRSYNMGRHKQESTTLFLYIPKKIN